MIFHWFLLTFLTEITVEADMSIQGIIEWFIKLFLKNHYENLSKETPNNKNSKTFFTQSLNGTNGFQFGFPTNVSFIRLVKSPT